jgi:hypothetical protein
MGGDKRGDIRGMNSGRLGKTWGNCLDKGPYLIPTIHHAASLNDVIILEKFRP